MVVTRAGKKIKIHVVDVRFPGEISTFTKTNLAEDAEREIRERLSKCLVAKMYVLRKENVHL